MSCHILVCGAIRLLLLFGPMLLMSLNMVHITGYRPTH